MLRNSIRIILLVCGLFVSKSLQFTYGTIQVISNGMDRHIFPFDDFPGASVFDLEHVTNIERATVEVTWTADQRFYNLEETFRILCFFWSSAPGDEQLISFTSQLFEPGSPLEDAFPAAEKVVCHANFKVDYEHEALLLTEYENGRLEMRDVPTIPRDGDDKVLPTRFKKTSRRSITNVKVMHVPDPRTVCQITYKMNRSKQLVLLRLGETYSNDEGGWIPRIYCYVE